VQILQFRYYCFCSVSSLFRLKIGQHKLSEKELKVKWLRAGTWFAKYQPGEMFCNSAVNPYVYNHKGKADRPLAVALR